MKRFLLKNTRLLLLMGGLVVLVSLCFLASRFGHLTVTPPVTHKLNFSANTASYPSPITVSGNRLVNADGQPLTLHGLMAADPAWLAEKGNFNRSFYERMVNTGANVIRIPVHPERWERDPDYLWRYLDPIVAWNGEQGVYTILDLHFIGNIETGSGSLKPDIRRPAKDFTLAFWRQTAGYFKDAPNVIFEIFNEPQDISSADWRRNAEEIVAAIRAAGAKQLILVGGIDYSKDLSWVLDQPVAGDNIAYAVHIFPAHDRILWDTWFGNVSSKYPVLVTEWGWMETAADSDSAYLVGSRETYGDPLLNYLDRNSIHWMGCWYDDEWLPPMFTKGTTRLTPYGEFVSEKLSSGIK